MSRKPRCWQHVPHLLLKADDSLTSGGDEPRFRIRDTGEWRKLAADLETEMIKRGMMFEVIEWDAGQIKLPLGD